MYRFLEAVEVLELGRPILARAFQPMPTTLGTLVAIHLLTTLLWKDRNGAELVMAAHDEVLATASRTSGLQVAGQGSGGYGPSPVASPLPATYNAPALFNVSFNFLEKSESP